MSLGSDCSCAPTNQPTPSPQVCAARKSQAGSLGSHDHSEEDHTFQLPYDILLCSVRASGQGTALPC